MDLVFPNAAGNVEWYQNIIRRGLWPALIEAGVTAPNGKLDDEGKPVLKARYTGLQALRCWFASWCISSKADGGLGCRRKRSKPA